MNTTGTSATGTRQVDTAGRDGAGAVPRLVALTRRIEATRALDGVSRLLAPAARALLSSPRRADLLHGMPVGHAVHPPLTDVPIGAWTCASLLDLAGGERARPAAQGLLAVGLVAAAPTAVTGLAEWGQTRGAEQRVGTVHAAANTLALGLYGLSWLARRRGNHTRGTLLALCGGTALSVGGYLGGHLTSARKVSSRHPSYDTD